MPNIKETKPYSDYSYSWGVETETPSFPYVQQARLVLSPDALVMLYGDVQVKFCDRCDSFINFQKDITNIDVSLNIDSVPGTASFTVTAPRHDPQRYIKNGRLAFQPLMEVNIFMKGRYLGPDREPQYYQVFWGLITSVTTSYSAGQHTIQISCNDILRLWDMQNMNIAPSTMTAGLDFSSPAAFQNVFWDRTPHEIIYSLGLITKNMFSNTPSSAFTLNSPAADPKDSKIDILQQTKTQISDIPGKTQQSDWELVTDSDYNDLNAADTNTDTNVLSGPSIVPETKMNRDAGKKQVPDTNRAAWWEYRSALIFKNLRIFGLKPTVPEDVKKDGRMAQVHKAPDGAPNDKKIEFQSQNTIDLVPGANIDISTIQRFTPYFKAGNQQTFQDHWMSKLALANEVKNMIGYEFYMDTTGDIMFKPPFFNMEVKNHAPISIINDLDLISMSITEDEKEIRATRVDVIGTISTLTESNSETGGGPTGSYSDYSLAMRYGYRPQKVTATMCTTPLACFVYAMCQLDIQNANARTAVITIAGRSELRLGFPVYIENIDTYGYVRGIQHSFSFGGSFTTTLQINALRRRLLVDKYKFPTEEEKLDASKSFFSSGPTTAFYNPNLVLVFRDPEYKAAMYKDTQDLEGETAVLFKKLADLASSKTPNDPEILKEIENLKNQITINRNKYFVSQEKHTQGDGAPDWTHRSNTMVPGNVFRETNKNGDFGTIPGLWITVPMKSFYDTAAKDVVSLIINFLPFVVPVSDPKGYEFIGAMPYGFGLELDAKGNIVNNLEMGGTFNKRDLRSGAQNAISGAIDFIRSAAQALGIVSVDLLTKITSRFAPNLDSVVQSVSRGLKDSTGLSSDLASIKPINYTSKDSFSTNIKCGCTDENDPSKQVQHR